MKFLYSAEGMGDQMLLTPAIWKTPGQLGCTVWAADNEAYGRGFDAVRMFDWLEKMKPWRDSCLFVAVPDCVGDAVQTLELYREWAWHFDGWPLAFVAQDGQENLPLPNYYDTLFVGGSTEWKVGSGAEAVIRLAQRQFKHIHIGRVNWGQRYRHFALMRGSESWTCDGTRQRFDGRDKTKEAWEAYERQEPLIRL